MRILCAVPLCFLMTETELAAINHLKSRSVLKLVECFPNFSEGRRRDVIDAIVAEACSRNVRVLDVEFDADHNRPVLTFVGAPDAVGLAREFAKQYASRFNVPVFLYEEAAARPDRRNLADVRKGEFEGLRDEIGKKPDRSPDFGE